MVKNNTSFSHEMLVANAGSGKTYTLTTRIIRLLLAGVAIDRIAALTFTRKSAGEFLDELLLRIAEAATEPKEMAELAKATGQPNLTPEDCCRLLEHIVEHFGRLGLSTIDSFFTRIARQFPLESGLPEEFAIADSASLTSARERALAACFARGTEGDEALQAMIDQCRQISRQRGERNVFGMLLDQIESLHQRLLETPDGCTWGDAARIWKDGKGPQLGSLDIGNLIDRFENAVHTSNPALCDAALEDLHSGLEALRTLQPGQVWSKTLQTFIEKKLNNSPKDNHIRFGFRAKKADGWAEITPELKEIREQLIDALHGDAIGVILERSQGLHTFVSQYETVYSELIRNAGLISFADITAMLAERAAEADTLDALDWRTQVAYRIDQSFDHWLLDEFQDTSRSQWAILRAFIEEVVMDDADQRSFFYVGDTKQAIYGWRGGDADLFNEIFENYEPAIQSAKPLSASWRSTEPVIEMVNTIFGSLGPISDELKLPEATLAKWEKGWNRHDVADTKKGRPGYATWRSVEKKDKDETPAQHEEVLRILQEVDPLENDIECAVLLRQNKDVAELAAYLQAEGIPVAVEGKSNPCTDNLLGSAVLAALRTAAHPADSLSAAIARGLPCATAWGLDDIEHFREATLQSIAEGGYAPTIQRWITLAKVGTHAPMRPSESNHSDADGWGQPSLPEAFLADRGDALLAAAEAFDAKASSDSGIDAFIAYVESLEVQEAEAREAIRIMTVHQAKGLGFDMVIVAGLDKQGRSNTTDELVLGPDKKDPEWGLLMPRKDIAESDPVLCAQNELREADARTNELCGAYVALTRAKDALYVISDALTEKSTAKHFGRHLQLTLNDGWSAGDAAWFNVAEPK